MLFRSEAQSTMQLTTLARSMMASSMPLRPDVFSTGSTVMKSHQFCGARSTEASPPDVSRARQFVSSSNASVSELRSSPPVTGRLISTLRHHRHSLLDLLLLMVRKLLPAKILGPMANRATRLQPLIK